MTKLSKDKYLLIIEFLAKYPVDESNVKVDLLSEYEVFLKLFVRDVFSNNRDYLTIIEKKFYLIDRHTIRFLLMKLIHSFKLLTLMWNHIIFTRLCAIQ